ncbi:hypothetical protein L9F63_020162, partial [Diploptera punctata]
VFNLARENNLKMTVVSKWYSGQTILVTGATGFMGKVLLEKLLRTCPDIQHIYIIVRPKRGLAPSIRVEEMVKLPLFETLMKNNPDVLKKIIAIEGDITKPDLGLSKEQKKQLISEVTIVFHMAASLRLEAGMKAAIINNTLSTKFVLDFCLEMKELKVFIHLSTAFCHCDHDVMEEKVYPPPHNPHDIIHAMEWMDDETIEMITPRLLGPHPNCYTYSKRLAEYLVYEYKDKLPVCITRPSIVIIYYSDFLCTSWVDTLNGPIGLLVGGGKGVIRSMMCSPNSVAQVIPADAAVNSLITIAWICGNNKSENIPVYNVTSGDVKRVTWHEVLDLGRKSVYKTPFEYTIWYPDGDIRTNWLIHYICVILFHYLPAYLIDFLLFLARQKRFMVRVQNRISIGLEVLQYFTMRDWNFNNKNLLSIKTILSEEDRETFFIDNIDYDIERYIADSILGARTYCVKEPLSSLPRCRRNIFILYCLHLLTKFLFYGFLVWLVVQNLDSARFFLDYSANLLQKIPIVGCFIPVTISNS